MSRRFLTVAAKTALVDAVRAVERDSRAEVVVVVRPASASYPAAALRSALIAVFGALAFMLYSPWEFSLAWFLVDPAFCGLLAGLAVHRSPALVRLLTSSGHRRTTVHGAARATFVDRGVSATRDRTGLLLYVSLLEREAEIVADIGILETVEPAAWESAVAALTSAVRAGADGVQIAERLDGLGSLLAEALPAAPDDVNELPDEVVST